MKFKLKLKKRRVLVWVGTHVAMRPCGHFKERLSSLSMVGWDNRPYLAAGFEASKESLLGYSFWFRDRCRSGLSGTPGKRVLVKANRGFESLPVRSVSKDRVFNLPEAILGWA